MNLQVVFCNHQTADLDVRERLAFSVGEQLDRAYRQLQSRFPQAELVVLSTCNRVELYTAQETPEQQPTHDELARFFSEFHNVPLSDFSDDFLEHTGPDAVRHLFQVVSSVDSMVLGEPQIVSQVKEAYGIAQENSACGPLTHALFQGAIRVSGRVRTETRLAEGRVSIASVAVGEFGQSIFSRFDDKTVLIIGAGEMAEADVIVSTTGATEPIVSGERFASVRRNSDSKPVFILDLGAPRDFASDVGRVDDNVFLYDIDDLEATCRQNRETRATEIEKALRIIDEETDRFMHEVFHRATGPIIKRLREQWHDIRQEEVEKLRSRLSHLDPSDVNTIERSIERIVNKLLHPPLEALRDEAREGTPHGLLDALKRLFHLRD